VAVCGRGEARARSIGEPLGVPWFTDQVAMNSSVQIDAIVNLTPIAAHEPTALVALGAGQHVYCEKPLGTSIEGARRLRDEATARGLVLVAAPSVLLFPQVRQARQLLEEGAIGAVHTVRGLGFGGIPPWQGYDSDPAPFFAPGAGPLVDLGVYPLHAITGLLGPARRVAAMGARTRETFDIIEGPLAGTTVPVDVDDAWVVTLDLDGGLLATVEANFTAVGTRSAELELMGERGTIALSLLDVADPIHVLDPGGAWTALPVETGRPVGGPDHILGVEHLVDRILDGGAVELSADHAIHVIEVLHAAARSTEAGTAVELTTTFDGPSTSAVLSPG
jgi:predicted dehydrogenase